MQNTSELKEEERERERDRALGEVAGPISEAVVYPPAGDYAVRKNIAICPGVKLLNATPRGGRVCHHRHCCCCCCCCRSPLSRGNFFRDTPRLLARPRSRGITLRQTRRPTRRCARLTLPTDARAFFTPLGPVARGIDPSICDRRAECNCCFLERARDSRSHGFQPFQEGRARALRCPRRGKIHDWRGIANVRRAGRGGRERREDREAWDFREKTPRCGAYRGNERDTLMPLFGNLELLVAQVNNNAARARARTYTHVSRSSLVTRRRASSRDIIPAAVLPRSHIAARKSGDEGRSRALDRAVAVTAADLLRHCAARARAPRSPNADLAIIADLSGAKWLRRFIADVTSARRISLIDIRVR